MQLTARYPKFTTTAVLLAIPALAAAQSAKVSPRIHEMKDAVYMTIDVPGSTMTCLTGISPTGKIVGVYTTDQDVDPKRDCWHSTHLTGFLLEGDRFTDLKYPVPPGPVNLTIPQKINAKGTVVGFWVSQQPPDSVEGGWKWENGKFSDVNYAGEAPDGNAGLPQITNVFGVTSSGDMSGGVVYLKNTHEWNPLHGWSYDAGRGVFQLFDPEGCLRTYPLDINDRGDIVGLCERSDYTFFGYIRDKTGSIRQVDSVPDSWNALAQEARGINAEGVIIGSYYVYVPGWNVVVPHGYAESKGVFTPIDPPGAGGSTPWGISPSGVIVGSYAVPDEYGLPRIHGFVRIPKGRL